MVTVRMLAQVPAYLLFWPEGRPHTEPGQPRAVKDRTRGFAGNLAALKDEILRSKLGERRLSMNLRPHSRDAKRVADPGVALWFVQGEDPTLSVLASNRYPTLAFPEPQGDPLQLTLQRLRLVEEFGAYSLK